MSCTEKSSNGQVSEERRKIYWYRALLSKCNMFVNHLWILLKGKSRFSRSRVEPELLHFQKSLRWCWCYWSMGLTMSIKCIEDHNSTEILWFLCVITHYLPNPLFPHSRSWLVQDIRLWWVFLWGKPSRYKRELGRPFIAPVWPRMPSPVTCVLYITCVLVVLTLGSMILLALGFGRTPCHIKSVDWVGSDILAKIPWHHGIT